MKKIDGLVCSGVGDLEKSKPDVQGRKIPYRQPMAGEWVEP
jgi:hypothetical protein